MYKSHWFVWRCLIGASVPAATCLVPIAAHAARFPTTAGGVAGGRRRVVLGGGWSPAPRSPRGATTRARPVQPPWLGIAAGGS